MKRILVLAAALLLVATMAQAGDYHKGAQLICSDCHVMHASVSRTIDDWDAYTTATPSDNTFLLKGGPSAVCLSCHDGQDAAAPDVMGANAHAAPVDRSAGALNSEGGGTSPVNTSAQTSPSGENYTNERGHTIGATGVAPGETGSYDPDNTDGLSCVDCHQPHGYSGDCDGVGVDACVVDVSGNDLAGNDPTPTGANATNGTYRNLNWGSERADSSSTSLISISYNETAGTNTLTRDVFQRSTTGLGQYEFHNVDLNEPNTSNSGFAAWCEDCHQNFHGAVAGSEIGGTLASGAFIRHPQAEVDIGGIGGGHSNNSVFAGNLWRVRVMSANGTWGDDDTLANRRGTAWTTAVPTDLTPTCLSCHKAHGNGRPFGLIYADGDAAGDFVEDGTGAYRDLCKQCHVQGG